MQMLKIHSGGGYQRLYKYWLQVFFYSFLFSIILYLCGLEGDMSIKAIIKSVFPISGGVYWYFSSFAVLLVFKPYIDKLLNILKETELRRLFFILLVFFSFSGLLTDAYKTLGGYSSLWIMVLYVIGYILKKTRIFHSISTKILLSIWIVINIVSWITVIFLDTTKFISYVSPTVLFSAIILLVVFSRLKLECKVLTRISGLTFGIYLFQSNRIVYENTLSKISSAKSMNIVMLLGIVLLYAILLFAIGGVIEYVRMKTFQYLKINKIADCFSNVGNYFIQKI